MSKSSKARLRSEIKPAPNPETAEVIRTRCSNELKERVGKFAKALKTTESAFLREAVVGYMDALEKGGQHRHFEPPHRSSS
jgi:hypothetical protein